MSDAVIQVENVSKRYVISHEAKGDGLRHAVANALKSPWRWLRRQQEAKRQREEEFWALRGVSVEIKAGEVVGLVGRNGAGKSTLLKVLSRIVEPTSGRVRIRGRVASLLEVGTGFHGELTGRENVFLNGAILGMSRLETKKKFDEIVAFADIDRFLDTPVKRYSSGMYVRLAFAVAAHLEPDILLVDEVLAVGDAQFQKKCLGRLTDAASSGRTVVFVSHHMPSVNRLCRRGVLLEGGVVKLDGTVDEVTARYLNTDGGRMGERHWTEKTAPGDDVAKLSAVRVKQNGESCDTVDIRFSIDIEMEFVNTKRDADLLCCLSLFNDEGVHLFNAADWSNQKSIYAPGAYTAVFTIPGNLLTEGLIRICAEVSTRAPIYQMHFLVHDAAAFQVSDSGAPGSVRAGWGRGMPGVVRPSLAWRIQSKSPVARTLSNGGGPLDQRELLSVK